MRRYGFEQRNHGFYVVACWLCLVASSVLAVLSISSAKPEWMRSGLTPLLVFSVVTIMSGTLIRWMPRLGRFSIAGLGALFVAFGIAYMSSGGQQRLAVMLIVAGSIAFLIPTVLGRRSDEQAQEDTFRIRWPW